MVSYRACVAHWFLTDLCHVCRQRFFVNSSVNMQASRHCIWMCLWYRITFGLFLLEISIFWWFLYINVFNALLSEKFSKKRWSDEEISSVRKVFAIHLRNGSLPSQSEICNQQNNHAALQSRTWQQIKTWISNQHKKDKSHWAATLNIILNFLLILISINSSVFSFNFHLFLVCFLTM